MRADPKLSRVLDSPRLASALAAIRADPAALSHYAGDEELLAVLGRLLEADLGAAQAGALRELGTTPQGLMAAVAGDPCLAAALAAPRVRAALADIRINPVRGMQRWQADTEVMSVLDQLQGVLDQGGSGRVVDVDAQKAGAGSEAL